jgi:DNA-binding transcriptional LysR family regulator
MPDKLKAELDYVPVLSEPLILAAPQGIKALRGKKTIALKTLSDLPLIIFPRRIAPAFHDAILACFRDAGLTPHIGQEAIQMQTIVGLVSAGMGFALVPQSVSNLKRPGVAYRVLLDKTPFVETGLAWRRDNTSPVLHAFLELLREKNKC